MSTRVASRFCALTCLIFMAAQPVGWRVNGNGNFPDADPPTEWSSEKGMVWKTPIPGKTHASLIVVGDRIFTTGEPAELYCLSRDTGEILWHREHTYEGIFGKEKAAEIEAQHEKTDQLKRELGELKKAMRVLKDEGKLNEKTEEEFQAKIKAKDQEYKIAAEQFPPPKRGGSGNSTATPVSDGKSVYCMFAHGVVSAHTIEGKPLWMKSVQPSVTGFGHSTSPVLSDGKLIVHYQDLFAFEPETGKLLWKLETNQQRWGTPVATTIGKTPVVVLPNGLLVNSQTGEELQQKLFSLSHNSPILVDRTLYGLSNGRNVALKIPDQLQNDTQLEVLWEEKGFNQRTFASPGYHDGLLYLITEKGILSVTDAKTGENIYQKRLDLGRGRAYSSVTAAGDYLFVGSDSGTMVVFKPGKEFELVSTNELEGFSGNPVFLDNRMYLRGKEHVYCIGK